MLKIIYRLLGGNHNSHRDDFYFRIKSRYKRRKKNSWKTKVVYDCVIIEKCSRCGTQTGRRVMKRGVTWSRAKRFMKDYYDLNF